MALRRVDDASPRPPAVSLAVRLPPRPRLELTQVSFELQRARHRVLVPRDVRLHGRAQTRGEFVDERANVRVPVSIPAGDVFVVVCVFVSVFPRPRPRPRPVPAAEVRLRRRRRPRREFQRRRARRRAFLSRERRPRPRVVLVRGELARLSLAAARDRRRRPTTRARDVTRRRRAPPSPIRTPLTRHSSRATPHAPPRTPSTPRTPSRHLRGDAPARAAAASVSGVPKRIRAHLVARTSAVAARTARSTTPTPSLIISSALESPVNRPDARSHASEALDRGSRGRRGEWLHSRNDSARVRSAAAVAARDAAAAVARERAARASPRDPRANLRRPGESNPFRFEGFPVVVVVAGSTVVVAGSTVAAVGSLRVLLPRAAKGPSRGNETGGENLLVGRTIRSRHREMCRRGGRLFRESLLFLRRRPRRRPGGEGENRRAPLRGVAT